MGSRATAAAAKPPANGRPRATRQVTTEYVAALRDYAEVLYKGGLGGKDANRMERVAVLIEVGRDLGIPATQATAWIAIINGRPTIWGDLAMALIRSSGLLADGYPKEWYEGTPGEDDYTACFEVKRTGNTPARVSKFSVADAKRAKLWGNPKKLPWVEYPERQLMWRAKGFACRDEFQDVLCGLVFAEEAMDQDADESPRVVVATASGPGPDREPPPAGVTVSAPPKTPLPGRPAALPVAAEETFSLVAPTAGAASTPVTEEQLAEIAELRERWFVGKAIQDDADACDAAWAEALAQYGVESARDMTAGQAAELIEWLGGIADPFGHPKAVAAG